jgi:hypothetical protein
MIPLSPLLIVEFVAAGCAAAFLAVLVLVGGLMLLAELKGLDDE